MVVGKSREWRNLEVECAHQCQRPQLSLMEEVEKGLLGSLCSDVAGTEISVSHWPQEGERRSRKAN